MKDAFGYPLAGIEELRERIRELEQERELIRESVCDDSLSPDAKIVVIANLVSPSGTSEEEVRWAEGRLAVLRDLERAALARKTTEGINSNE